MSNTVDSNAFPWITLIIVVSLLSAGLLAVGLVFGYLRGVQRGREIKENASADLDKLAGVGRAILGAQLRVDALCEIVYQQSARIVETDDFQLGLFDGSDYVIKVWVRSGERLDGQRFADASSSGLIGWVRTSAQGLLVGDFQREWNSLPAKPNYDSANPPRSAVFVPLIAGGDVIGVLSVFSDRPDTFTDESRHLLMVLSSQAAGAIRNAQLYEQTRQRADQLRVIAEVGRQITSIQPLPNLFRQIVTLVHDNFHYYAVSILTCEESNNEIRLRASSNAAFEQQALVHKPDEGLIGWAYTNKKTANSPDVAQDSRFIYLATLDQTKSEICVPLIVEQRVLGILDVQSDQLNAFKDDDIFTLESLAGQLALALQEAQSYDMERRQTQRINAMAEASRAVVSILDINQLLDQVVDLIADHFDYDRVHLFLRSGDQVVFRSGSGVHSGKWAIEHLTYNINDKGFIAWVARQGEPLVSGNVHTDDRYLAAPGIEDSASEMTVPIRMGQRALGVFDIQSILPNAFSDEDVRLVQALADTVAIGLRNAGLFATETRRRMLAETLREVSTVLASSLDLASVLDGILLGLERVVNYDAALIMLLELEANLYRVSAVRGAIGEADLIGETVPADEKLSDNIHELMETIEPPHVEPAESDRGYHDHLFVPLQVGGKDIGILSIDRLGSDHFNPEDIEIITTFANQASVAIANAQLYTAQKEEAWVSTALLQVAEATGRATTLDEVLSTVARITPLLVGVQWCAVFLTDRDTFRVVEIEGANPQITAALKGYIFKDSDWEPFRLLRKDGKPLVIDPEMPLPTTLPIALPRTEHAVMLPLYAKGEVMGAMLIGQRDGAELMTERKIELVSGIANQAALAIESAQLFAAQQEEAWVTTALLSVAESANSTLGLKQTLRTIVRLVPMLVGVNRCGIMQWEPEAGHFVGGAAWGLTHEAEQRFAGIILSPKDNHFIYLLSTSPEPQPSDRDPEKALPESLARLFETDGLIGFPLIAKGNLVGAMLVDRTEPGELMSHRRVNILVGTAQQVALAVETAHLQEQVTERQRLERELEVARGIQHSFLPQQVPTLPGWDLAAFYRTARQVGGDFYDFIPLKNNKWGIVIADVADKGVPAALFMVLSRTNIRASAFSRDNPVETLERVNELLLADSRSDLFVTAWYGVWDPSTGEIVYASGGHNPPLLIRASGICEELSAHGIALGVIPSIKLEEKRITLLKNDLLVAYTDGVTEAMRSDGTDFGVVGLQSTAANARYGSAAEIMQRIVQTLDAFAGSEPQFDDLTLITLKRTDTGNS
ncbi:MAG: GAF domain-containing protein [Chloroflexota bacterium]